MPDNRPNIVLFLTDQQRYDTLGPHKPPFLRTPNLDCLAARGVCFDRTYADSPACVPSRTCLMSGKRSWTMNMTANGKTSDVMGRNHTLPWYLRELGYQTYGVGKMHFSPARARHGFDDILLPDDYYNEMRTRGYDLQPMRHGLGQNELTPTCSTVPEALSHTNWVAQKSMEFIMERRDTTAPFFLMCSFSKPHPPFDPPEPYYSMYQNEDIPEPVFGDWADDDHAPMAFRRNRGGSVTSRYTPEIIRAARAAYYGMITQIDYNIGRVLAALREISGNRSHENTLILFVSDHGEYLLDHGNAGKVFHHDCSARVPLMVHYPDGFNRRLAGKRTNTLANLADLLPTILSEVGGDIPGDIEGIDLTAVVEGRQPGRKYTDMQFGPGPETGRAVVSITDGRWKYCWYPEGPAEQLFDMQTDPHECRNLAGESDVACEHSRLRDALIAMLTDRNSPFVHDGNLVHRPAEDDRIDGVWPIFGYIPGNTLECSPIDIKH